MINVIRIVLIACCTMFSGLAVACVLLMILSAVKYIETDNNCLMEVFFADIVTIALFGAALLGTYMPV